MELIKMPAILNALKEGYKIDYSGALVRPIVEVITTSPVGLPVEITYTAVNVIKANAKVTVKGTPDLTTTITTKKKIPQIITMEANGHPWY